MAFKPWKELLPLISGPAMLVAMNHGRALLNEQARTLVALSDAEVDFDSLPFIKPLLRAIGGGESQVELPMPGDDERITSADLLRFSHGTMVLVALSGEVNYTVPQVLEKLRRFSTNVVHDLRNPLSVISFSSQLLDSETLSEEGRRMLHMIHSQVKRMDQVLEALPRIGRSDQPMPDTIDLKEFVHGFVAEFRDQKGLESDVLAAQVQDQPVTITFDRRHLRQVVWNLVKNALRFSERSSVRPRVLLIITTGTDGVTPVLQVRDFGIGIREEQLPGLFSPLYSAADQGSGLGLYTAQQLCVINGAELTYLKPQGEGSLFQINFRGRA